MPTGFSTPGVCSWQHSSQCGKTTAYRPAWHCRIYVY